MLALIVKKRALTGARTFAPMVTVVVPAYNEERAIEHRIQNLLELNYPEEKMERLIGSDGSTDTTVSKAKQFTGRGIKVVEFEKNRGRADVHNALVQIACGEIVVFTDADTRFEKDFVKEITRPFAVPAVGCVVGRLIYQAKNTTISEAEAVYYNRWELWLKEAESRVGVLANGTGACMAIRKQLFRPLTPVDDVDTATVIDVIRQGYTVVFAQDAIAYDVPPKSVAGELRYRVRATAKTIRSLMGRMGFKLWLTRPAIAWSVFSHRGTRYLTPFLMLAMLIANLFLLHDGLIYQLLFGMQLAFYGLAVTGWIGESTQRKIPIASLSFGFGVAMLGILLGVSRVITNRVPSTYAMDD